MKTLHDALQAQTGDDPNTLTLDAARRIVAALARPVDAIESVALRSALGRVLARELMSPLDVPAYDNSAMDGYAFPSAALTSPTTDGKVHLAVAGCALAGHPFDGIVAAGQCLRITTGARVPAGCDTVIAQEQVQTDGNIVTFETHAITPGRHVRRAGEDLAAGQPAMRAGKILRPADIGLLASLGIVEVPVHRRLRVAFFSTGDELRAIGQPLDDGALYDSNRYTLFGMLTRLGVEILDLGIVRDDPDALEATFRIACRHADVVITTGGVSVGEADFTRALMARLGDVVFGKIAMRPGRPFAFGRLRCEGHEALLFGLPGNPAAAMASFYLIVRDALLAMMGASPQPQPCLPVPSTTAIAKRKGRTECLRGTLTQDDTGRWQVTVAQAQGAGILRTMSEASCFVVLEHERGDVTAGETVGVMIFDGLV